MSKIEHGIEWPVKMTAFIPVQAFCICGYASGYYKTLTDATLDVESHIEEANESAGEEI